MRKYRNAYDALCEQLSKDATVGECIAAIEAALPAEALAATPSTEVDPVSIPSPTPRPERTVTDVAASIEQNDLQQSEIQDRLSAIDKRLESLETGE